MRVPRRASVRLPSLFATLLLPLAATPVSAQEGLDVLWRYDTGG